MVSSTIIPRIPRMCVKMYYISYWYIPIITMFFFFKYGFLILYYYNNPNNQEHKWETYKNNPNNSYVYIWYYYKNPIAVERNTSGVSGWKITMHCSGVSRCGTSGIHRRYNTKGLCKTRQCGDPKRYIYYNISIYYDIYIYYNIYICYIFHQHISYWDYCIGIDPVRYGDWSPIRLLEIREHEVLSTGIGYPTFWACTFVFDAFEPQRLGFK